MFLGPSGDAAQRLGFKEDTERSMSRGHFGFKLAKEAEKSTCMAEGDGFAWAATLRTEVVVVVKDNKLPLLRQKTALLQTTTIENESFEQGSNETI